MKEQLILSLFLVCLYSCSSANKGQYQHENTYSIIDLTNIRYSDKPSRLSEFVDSISYIRLAEEPLLPDLFNLGITVTDDAFYVEKAFIYKYDLEGKFIKSLFNMGQGPGEANKKNKAAYDFKNKIVAVNNNMGITYRLYTLEGEYIGDTPNSYMNYEKFIIAYIDGKEVYYNMQYCHPQRGDTLNYDGPYFIQAKDLKTNEVIYKQPNYHYDIKAIVQNAMIIDGEYPFCYGTLDSLFWWKHQSVDTIYCTSDFKEVHPWYVLKKNKSFADYEFCVHRIVLDIPVADFGRKLISATYPLENGLLYSVVGGMDDSGAGFCRRNGKGLVYSQKGFINDVDEYFKYWIPYNFLSGNGCVKDGWLYTLMNASDFFEEDAKSPFPDLTEESNPVIVKFKLKKYEE